MRLVSFVVALCCLAVVLLHPRPVFPEQPVDLETSSPVLEVSPGDTPASVPEKWTEPVTGMEFVRIPTGCFLMGTPETEIGRDLDEGPMRRVCFESFWMGTYEVTVKQFQLFVSETGYKTGAEYGKGCEVYKGEFQWDKVTYWRQPGFSQSESDPVVCVTWNDSRAFAYWLSKKTGLWFRLPTEAEWEYACRARTTTARWWGNQSEDSCEFANVHDKVSKEINGFPWDASACSDGFARTAPVGSFPPNSWGVHDILGNVWEWCEDSYGLYREPVEGHRPVDEGVIRVLRGGSWKCGPEMIRCGYRNAADSDIRSDGIGFRLVRVR